jgi:phage terminase large subunit-like protein
MRSDQRPAIGQRPTLDLDAPPSTYRISVDVDMLPAGMGSEQACGLLVAALEAAHTVRAVRVNQCSTLTKDGMHRQDCDGSVSRITP